MSATKPEINPLDPFGENESHYKSKEIRRSRSRLIGNLFTNLIRSEDKQARAQRIFVIILLLIIIISVGLLLLLPRSETTDPTVSDNPLINPTGREATGEFTTDNLDDPELRLNEQKKLNTVLLLISSESWEHANANFETIFPDYLDECGRYDYYRAAVILADNFAEFSIERDVAEARMNYLIEKCDAAKAE